jgi:hypothetical protein
MAQQVCDTKPCYRLQEALRTFFNIDPSSKDGCLTVQARGPTGKSRTLYFRYCPFCGTRVSQGAVEFVTAA